MKKMQCNRIFSFFFNSVHVFQRSTIVYRLSMVQINFLLMFTKHGVKYKKSTINFLISSIYFFLAYSLFNQKKPNCLYTFGFSKTEFSCCSKNRSRATDVPSTQCFLQTTYTVTEFDKILLSYVPIIATISQIKSFIFLGAKKENRFHPFPLRFAFYPCPLNTHTQTHIEKLKTKSSRM